MNIDSGFFLTLFNPKKKIILKLMLGFECHRSQGLRSPSPPQEREKLPAFSARSRVSVAGAASTFDVQRSMFDVQFRPPSNRLPPSAV